MIILNWLSTLRSFIGAYAGWVKAPWALTLIWAISVAAVVWFYGDALAFGSWHPLANETVRMVAVLVVFGAWGGYYVWTVRKSNSTDAELTGHITHVDGSEDTGRATQEVAELKDRLQSALKKMRKVAGSGRGLAYRLPWYVLIGPPGAGKTTALTNSGLKFPLGEGFDGPIEGVGGTRKCDWWFTEDAILIDTAGRYTMQEGDGETDRAGWMGFLSLLKRYRPLQPINGALVMLGLDETLNATPAERLRHARAIRQRLRELEEVFGLRVPVYLVLTKADLLAGFTPFFETYGRSDREQVWGMTFPLEDRAAKTSGALEAYATEFDLLVERINALLLDRLQQETDIERRNLIFSFPSQVALLKGPVEDILSELCTSSKFEQPPLIRGIYLASATQTGAPFDRLMQSMAATFGVAAPAHPAFSGTGNSFFLTRLFNNVVFEEANLVSFDPKAARKRTRLRQFAAAAAVAALLICGGVWSVVYARNQAILAETNARIDAYTASVGGLAVKDVADADFARVAAALDQLKATPGEFRDTSLFSFADFGIGQDNKVMSGYANAYERALNTLLLPRVMIHLQNRMQANIGNSGPLLELLKVYLMLGGQGPLDPSYASAIMRSEWVELYPNDSRRPLRDSLEEHFAALVAQPIAQIAIDDALVTKARSMAGKQSTAERAYSLIKNSRQARDLGTWRPNEKMGSNGERVFTRVSGRPLSEGIPAFFTQQGYQTVLLPALPNAGQKVNDEQWVLGSEAQGRQDDLAHATLELYLADYRHAWNGILADIKIVPLADFQQAAEVLTLISAPNSPMQSFLAAVGNDSNLSPSREGSDKPQADALPLDNSGLASGARSEKTDPFAGVRVFVANDPSAGITLKELNQTLNTLYQHLNRAANATDQVNSMLRLETALSDTNQTLLADSRRLPSPVDLWMAALASNVDSLSIKGTRSQLSEQWGGSGAQLCNRVARSYPLSETASSELSIEDFSRLFGPGGVMDSFFQKNLQEYVNTSRRPWRWRGGYGRDGETSPALKSFEIAAQIRDAFFPDGGKTPSMRFEVTPQSLDSASTSVLLSSGDQEVRYRHGPQRSMTLDWPAQGMAQARLSFQPDGGNTSATTTGPWALFHLLDRAVVTPATADKIEASFALGTRNASFEVRVSSAINPLTTPLFKQFRCPKGL